MVIDILSITAIAPAQLRNSSSSLAKTDGFCPSLATIDPPMRIQASRENRSLERKTLTTLEDTGAVIQEMEKEKETRKKSKNERERKEVDMR